MKLTKKKIYIGATIALIVLLFLFNQRNSTISNLPIFKIIREQGTKQLEEIVPGERISVVKVVPPINSDLISKFIKFEFSKDVSDGDFKITVKPDIKIQTTIPANNPKILIITPETMWARDVLYTITIKGPRLEQDIVYTLKNSPKEFRE